MLMRQMPDIKLPDGSTEKTDCTTNGCSIIVMELLQDPEHALLGLDITDRFHLWFDLCHQVLDLYRINDEFVYTDSKLSNIGYDPKSKKLRLIDLASALNANARKVWVATYPPPLEKMRPEKPLYPLIGG